ncbi:hypothetical protein TGPRC2_427490 [Toxoplasma gondii TgCatPRC2]|uniref:Uncharacterized protein n=1 Tax=Toxoplasma gondii TgCatPRC2 TaxID=1130821 RepID=A0A151GZ54_TOXGO|nr:hypothetical protein TGPRC2_427490 [Toxoplasma gondii TgCatPRC2]
MGTDRQPTSGRIRNEREQKPTTFPAAHIRRHLAAIGLRHIPSPRGEALTLRCLPLRHHVPYCHRLFPDHVTTSDPFTALLSLPGSYMLSARDSRKKDDLIASLVLHATFGWLRIRARDLLLLSRAKSPARSSTDLYHQSPVSIRLTIQLRLVSPFRLACRWPPLPISLYSPSFTCICFFLLRCSLLRVLYITLPMVFHRFRAGAAIPTPTE